MSQTVAIELETKLKTFAASHSLPVAYEGNEFKKPVGTNGESLPFLECFLVPSDTFNVSIDGLRKRDTGVFKVNVWFPTRTGTGVARTLAQSVVDAFPIVPKTGLVSVESTPSVGRLITDVPGWIIVPVTISYRYEH